jgi:hypothetical protein
MNKIEEYENTRRKQLNRTRSIVDYTMGILFFGVGIYLVLFDKREWPFFNLPKQAGNYILGGLFLVYGVWRIYRGYKKNYFRE